MSIKTEFIGIRIDRRLADALRDRAGPQRLIAHVRNVLADSVAAPHLASVNPTGRPPALTKVSAVKLARKRKRT